MIRLGILVLLVLMGTKPAVAEWQYTAWGMTEQDVIAASSGLAIVTDSGSMFGGYRLSAPYSASGFTFTANFRFNDEGGLDRVMLDGDVNCLALEEAMYRRYSGGVQQVEGSSMDTGTILEDGFWGIAVTRWRDTEGGNAITFNGSWSITENTEDNFIKCDIVYEDILGKASGL